MMIVLDASIIIKWFTQEISRDSALKYRMDFENGLIDIVLPDLILYEIANALRYNPSFSPEDVARAIESLFEMDMEIMIPTREMLKEAVRIAHHYDITIYDASYIALAKELGCDFITADDGITKKASDLSYVKTLPT